MLYLSTDVYCILIQSYSHGIQFWVNQTEFNLIKYIYPIFLGQIDTLKLYSIIPLYGDHDHYENQSDYMLIKIENQIIIFFSGQKIRLNTVLSRTMMFLLG